MIYTITDASGHLRRYLCGPLEPGYCLRLQAWAEAEGLTITRTCSDNPKPNLASQDSASNRQSSKFAPKSPRGSCRPAPDSASKQQTSKFAPKSPRGSCRPAPGVWKSIEAGELSRKDLARLSGLGVRAVSKQHQAGRYSPAVLQAARVLRADVVAGEVAGGERCEGGKLERDALEVRRQ